MSITLSCRLVLVAAISLAGLARAQEPLYLVPRTYVVAESRVQIDLKTGFGPTAGVVQWSDHPVRWTFVKTGLVQENRDGPEEWLKEGIFSPPLPAPGAVVVGVEFQPQVEDLSAAALGRILTEGPPPKSATVKVRHFRSAVAVLRTSWSADDDPASHVAVSESGLSAEIRPLMDPTRLSKGGVIKFEVSQRGREMEDVGLQATPYSKGRAVRLEPESVGGLNLRPDKIGPWGVSCTFAVPLKGDPEAQYAVYTATLCFQVPDSKEVGR